MNASDGQKVSIPMIAKHLGLSRSTVQAALSGTGTVSQVTRDRVRAVAKELGYQPNLMARAMRTQRTGMIGAIVPAVVVPLYQELVTTITHASVAHGYHALLSSSLSDDALEAKQIEHLCGINVEGLIIYPATPGDAARYADVAKMVPLVLLGVPDAAIAADVINVDQLLIGRQAVQHLLGLGRRRIAFLPTAGQYYWSDARRQGAETALAEQRLSLEVISMRDDKDLVASPTNIDPRYLHSWNIPTMHWEIPEHVMHGYHAMQAFLKQGGQCDGLITANDQLAYGALQAIKDAGVAVPDDISVLGCDDLFASAIITPSLTSFHLPMAEMGELAVQRLMAHIAQRDHDYQPENMLMRPQLVVRESCGSPTNAAPSVAFAR
ncbi:MAG TPA: LacI family DNA-binding transcriptional regulator [Armatimonadota bacterium]|nr:LacI family DNA-binding transcriptional regulator [Armatimonadota bacterium]